MLKFWIFPLLSALALALILGGSAPSSADLFPLQSGYNDCPPDLVMSQSDNASPTRGIAAIQPHLHAIPAFTADDVRNYLADKGVPGWSHFTIRKVLFITSQEVCERTRGEDTGLEPDTLVCFVEVWGTSMPIFSISSPGVSLLPPSEKANYAVFHAQTGNLLMFSN